MDVCRCYCYSKCIFFSEGLVAAALDATDNFIYYSEGVVDDKSVQLLRIMQLSSLATELQ